MLNDFVIPDLYPAAPEIFLVTMAMVLIFVDLAVGETRRWVVGILTVATLFGAAVITTITASGNTTFTFSNLFVDDALSDFLKLLTYLSVIMAIIYGRGYLAERGLDKGEYYLLVLFATLGMMVMISASSFVTLYLGLELLSLSLYALVAIDRDSVRATEAAMKYFILGSLASGLLLYGMSMLYGATGTLEITGVAQAASQFQTPKAIMVFGLVFTVAGIAFKLGLAPFHMWIPDVYHGAPTPITLLIGSASKFAAFALAMRLLVYGLLGLAIEWQKMMLIMAVISIGLGNLAAVAQTNLKRMLAYSAISHMGFMVLGLTSGVLSLPANPYVAVSAYSSSLYYMFAYVLMSMGAFGMILLLSHAGYEAENLEDFKGLNSVQETLTHLRVVHRLPVQPGSLPPGHGSGKVPDVETKMVDRRSHRTAGGFLFPQQHVDARELNHGDLFTLDDLTPDVRPKSRLDVHVSGVDVEMPDGGAASVGSGKLRERWSRGEYGESKQ